MATIQATSIADVLVSSLNQLGRMKFTDVMSNYQNTIALKRIFKKNKVMADSGPECQFNLMTDTNGSFRHTSLGYVHQSNMPNVLDVGKMPWRHSHWDWSVEHRLIAMNSGEAKIIDEAMKARHAALGDAIIGFERTLWRCPTLAEFDLNPVGIPYFVVKSATAATAANNDGFNGTVPTGYTLVANLNPSTDANGRYKNYADSYTSVAKDDLIRKMRRARYYTNFMPLVDNTPQYDTGTDYGIYTNYDVVGTMVEVLESQNDDLGSDVAPYEGSVMFNRTPVTECVELRADTTNPVYMLDWGCLHAKVLKGQWMKEQHFKSMPNQPTVSTTVVDCTWNMYCTNRRKQAVLSTGTTMPSGAGAA